MNQRSFNTYAGFIFLIVTIAHLLRVLKGWDVTISNFDLPIWASWAVILIAGCMAYHGLFKKK